jgi:hypothetical protein
MSVPMHSAWLAATQMVSKTSIAQLTGVGFGGKAPESFCEFKRGEVGKLTALIPLFQFNLFNFI